MRIEFSPPDITQEEINEVIETLRSGWITTGPKTKKLEKALSEFCGTEKTVCLNSATAAMELVLRLFKIGPGDEVITSAYTYSASASVIDHIGAKIVLCDINPHDLKMDKKQLAELINERTKAIIPVDIGGVMEEYDIILDLVEDSKSIFTANSPLQEELGRILILADAAHSLGSTHQGKKSGTIADFSCFSFHAVKNFTTAEGGAITWRPLPNVDSETIYKNLMLLALHGQSKDAMQKLLPGMWEYDIVFPGYKCNMTDILASLGLAQLRRYGELLNRRRELVEFYDKTFNGTRISSLKHQGEDFESCRHLYITRVDGIDEKKRNEIILKLGERGIAANVHYKPLPMHTAYKNLGFDIADFPNAYNFYVNEITLPLHTLLKDQDVEEVARNYKELIL